MAILQNIKQRIGLWILNRQIKKKDKNSDKLNEIADEYLKSAMMKHQQQLKVAEKINKASLLDKSTKTLKAQLIENMDDEEDYYDDEEDEEDDYGVEDLIKPIIQKFMMGNVASSPVSTVASATVPTGEVTPLKDLAKTLVDNSTEEQLQKLKEKFLKDI